MESEAMKSITDIISNLNYSGFIRAGLILIIGFWISIFARRAIKRFAGEKLSPQQLMMAQKGIFYLLFGITFTWFLNELGFSISVLLGAAGVLTVAIGFASQTSVSNIISGIFLLAEKPCEIGDSIEVSGVTGNVISIDLLSVKIKTFDNRFVRIPNEAILKANLTNLSRFPIRRIDLRLGVAYKENIETVRNLLFSLADGHPLCLDDPEPKFYFLGFGDSSIDLQFSVWTKRENFLELKNNMFELIKNAFDKNNIEIPFPHRSIGKMSETDAIPVKMIKDD